MSRSPARAAAAAASNGDRARRVRSSNRAVSWMMSRNPMKIDSCRVEREERRRRQRREGDRHADVHHRAPGPSREEAVEDRLDDVATVEGQDRDEVEQPDDRSRPPHRLARHRLDDAGVIQGVGAHQHQRQAAARDVGERSGQRDGDRPGPADRSLRAVGGVAGHELERDGGVGPRPARHEGVAQLVQQRERRHRPGQPDTELTVVAAGHHCEQDHEDHEPVAHVHGEPEQPELRLAGRGTWGRSSHLAAHRTPFSLSGPRSSLLASGRAGSSPLNDGSGLRSC